VTPLEGSAGRVPPVGSTSGSPGAAAAYRAFTGKSVNRAGSLCYNALLRLAPWCRDRVTLRLWRGLWRRLTRAAVSPVVTSLHGKRVVVGVGHPYPLILRDHPLFNAPLVALVTQASRASGSPVTVIDVGAGFGDTALLLAERCPGLIARIVCVEGDEEFVAYLAANLADRSDATVVSAVVSAPNTLVGGFVRLHPGTAGLAGEGRTASVTLDNLLAPLSLAPIDVIKIDVEGCDGRVLAGATATLARASPGVLFEWHPGHCRHSGSDAFEAFTVLDAAGYDRFAWFTKFGEFSHFSGKPDRWPLEALARHCTVTRAGDDWHYDVLALHSKSPLALESLVASCIVRQR